jgi:nucleoside-diphosphate-sugar epimerase
MTATHKSLLETAVKDFAGLSGGLKGAAVYVDGASGFLAASLLIFLNELNRQAGLGLRLFASARRPMKQVRLFDYLNVHPEIEWEVAPAESARLPDAKSLIVVHTASYGSPRDYMREPMETFSANTIALARLFQSDRTGLKQLVYFSSAEVYGQPPDAAIPTPESFLGGGDTLSSRSIYGESKRMGEVLGVNYAEKKKIPFTVLRPWNLYGPGQRLEDGRVPMEFIRQAMQEKAICLSSNGSPRRAFCYVWDGIRQIAATLGRTVPVEAFNVGNGSEEISILELSRQCAAACGLPATAVQFDAKAQAAGLQRCMPDTRAVSKIAPVTHPLTPLSTGLPVLRDWANFLAKP